MPRDAHLFDSELYYQEFLRYHKMAEIQHHECNLGTTPHADGRVKDPLMQNVHLYDVVARKYAGFTQIILDMWYGDTPVHPYAGQMHEVRLPIAQSFTGALARWGLAEWLYVFILHRVTGSGINYAKKPSGYSNTILPHLHNCDRLEDLTRKVGEVLSTAAPAYTSVGYQFPRFPNKESPLGRYKRGGDRFMAEYAPRLARDMAKYLARGQPKKLRELGEWMFEWNRENGLAAYRFQYAAVVSDVADFYPHLVDTASMFFYGSNAVECISYMTGGKRGEKYLDAVMERAMDDTGNVPYNLEDVACDFIRWVENYIKPGHDYDHLCRDSIWNTCRIPDHPYGRQKPMIDLGLIDSFNMLTEHPSDDRILMENGWTVEHYKRHAV